MTITIHAQGAERKRLVKTISDWLGVPAKYCGAPTFNYIQLFQRNILHEDTPYFLAMIISISAYSSLEIKPFESIRRASAIAAW